MKATKFTNSSEFANKASEFACTFNFNDKEDKIP